MVENIGLTIKLIHDSFSKLRVLVTGSSSLDLANKVSEPLTGRSEEVLLFPLSIGELSTNRFEAESHLSAMPIRGGYPGLWNLSAPDAYKRLSSLATNYVYRDAFGPQVSYDQTVIHNLLRLLAFQIGNEVSYNELASKLGVARETVARYVDLLEKAFIVFRRNQYRRNQRVEVGRLRKVYFADLGIRNALVDNFKPLEHRDDVGQLWENFCVVERLKWLDAHDRRVQSFYWRNNDKREIDIIEEEAGDVRAFECKYSAGTTVRVPKPFIEMYPAASFEVVNNSNIFDGLLK